MALNRKDIRTAAKGVSLEHRHFAFIAATLKAQHENTAPLSEGRLVVENTIAAFADACHATNPRFNRTRFLAACGVEA